MPSLDHLKGVVSALVTPYRADGGIDAAALAALAEFQIGQGVHGFYVGGSTGEAPLQSPAERIETMRELARAVAGRRGLIAHVGAASTAETIALGRAAAEAGYDAISAIPPWYYDFAREEVLAHYRAVADAVDLPLIIYNFPARTPRPLSTADLLALLDHPRIAGVKHTSQDLYQLERLKRARPDAVIWNGYDEMFVAGLAMGADGAIGTTYNFMGDLFVAMQAAMRRGEVEAARVLQSRANRVIDVLVEVGVIPGTKAILACLGLPCGVARAPFRPLTAAEEARVADCVATWLRPA